MGGYNFKPFEAGKPLLPQLTAERLNGLVDAINRNRPEFGDNITGQRTPAGVILRAKFQPSAANTDPDLAFFMSDATTTEGDPPEVSNKILINNGKINGEFPTGMGTEDYVLDVDDPSDCLIHLLVTFDPDTLEILSRDIATSTAAAFPDDGFDLPTEGVGQFAQMLGFTYFDSDDDFRIHQVYVGDLNFKIIYGQNNGKASALVVPCYSDWMDIPDPPDPP